MKWHKQPEMFERIRPRARKAAGQREDVRGSGIYPASGPWPKGKAPVRSPADWNERRIAGASKIKKPNGKSSDSSKARSIAQKAVERTARKIKSEMDEAYHQGQTTEKSGPVGKQIRTT